MMWLIGRNTIMIVLGIDGVTQIWPFLVSHQDRIKMEGICELAVARSNISISTFNSLI